MFLNLELIYCGTTLAFWSGLLTPIMVLELSSDPTKTDKDKDALSLKGMIFLGVGEVVGGFLLGYICDKIGSKNMCLVNVLIVFTTTGLTYWNLVQMEYNWVTYLVCFMWGINDGCSNIHINQMCGFEFES